MLNRQEPKNDVKFGQRYGDHKKHFVLRHNANQHAVPHDPLCRKPNFMCTQCLNSLKCEISRHFQLGEGPSRGLHDCEIFAKVR